MTREYAAHLVLRASAAFAFIYPAIREIWDPISWAAYFPPFVRALPIDTIVLLHLFGVIEVALALWLLSGRNIRIPAALMTLMLLGIVAYNFDQIDVLFRDLSIAAVTLALALWPTVGTSVGAAIDIRQ